MRRSAIFRTSRRRPMSRVTTGGAALAALAAYTLAIRPRLLRWGATEEDVKARLPGDDLLEKPRYTATRAITIHARPSDIWPWLVQLGQSRGGFYSYDWLENVFRLEIQSADHIVPEWQHLEVGDRVRLTPENRGDISLHVAAIEPERSLVLITPGDRERNFAAGLPFGTWAFVIRTIDDQTSRLIVRWRSDYPPTFRGLLLNEVMLQPVHFAMERKMLTGIKERVEATVRRREDVRHGEALV